MNPPPRLYLGRKVTNAAMVAPLAELIEGSWSPVKKERVLFPPNGMVELRVLKQFQDEDFLVFNCAEKDRPRAPTKFRAISPRKVYRFDDDQSDINPEAKRVLLTQTGLEDGFSGEQIVRIGAEFVAKITLIECDDGRLRATGKYLSSLPLRRFSAEHVIDTIDIGLNALKLYNYSASEETGICLNWSTDKEFLLSIAKTLQNADLITRLNSDIEQYLTEWIVTPRHSLSSSNNSEQASINDIERAEGLAQRLRSESEIISLIRNSFKNDPIFIEAVKKQTELDIAAVIPRLEAEAEKTISLKMAETLKAAEDELKASIAELETAELSRLDELRNSKEKDLEVEIKALRDKLMKQVDDDMSGEIDRNKKIVTGLITDAQLVSDELSILRETAASLQAELKTLELEKRNSIELLHKLASLKESLKAPLIHNRFCKEKWNNSHEIILPLNTLKEKLNGNPLLSTTGRKALMQFAALLAASEVPVLYGPGAEDLLAIASALFTSGRIIKQYADPTFITDEDLWVRPSTRQATPFSSAFEQALQNTDLPILGAIINVEQSGARFWYEALRSTVLDSSFPTNFFICCLIDDTECEESLLLLKQPCKIYAEHIIAEGVDITASIAVSKLVEVQSSLTPFRIRPNLDLLNEAAGLGLVPAERLSRFAAAAETIMNKSDATLLIAQFSEALRLREHATNTASTLSSASKNSNA